jgi:essential nuclear protein 1
MPKATSSRAAAARRHNPLAEDITSAGQVRTQSNKKGKSRSQNDEEEGENGQRFIDAKMSRKILQIGQELADEDEAETKRAMGAGETMPNPAFDFDARLDEQDEALSDDENVNYENDEWLDEDVQNAVRKITHANDLDMRQTLMFIVGG